MNLVNVLLEMSLPYHIFILFALLGSCNHMEDQPNTKTSLQWIVPHRTQATRAI